MNTLAQLAMDSSNMMVEFETFLEEEFGYRTKMIFKIVDAIVDDK